MASPTTQRPPPPHALATAAPATAADASRMAREFTRARRHSLLVRLLKVGLPVLAVLIVVAGVGITWLARAMPDNLSLAGADFQDGRIVMDAPRIDGFDKSNRPYSMSAQKAIQAIDATGIELETVSARFAVSDALGVDVTARSGHYETQSETLVLGGDIRVNTSDGMTITLARATIRPSAGTLDGEGPVAIRTGTQSIDAGAVSISDNGDRLRFSQGLKMILQPRSTQTAQKPGETASAEN